MLPPNHVPQPQHVEQLLTPQEHANAVAAGVQMDLLFKILRAFISSLLTSVPGISGTQAAPQIPSGTAARPR